MESSDSISFSCFLDSVNKGTDDSINDLPLIDCTTETDPPHDRCSLLNDDFAIYQCELCGLSFKKERQYMGHLGSHSKEKIWNCVLCDGSFATNSQLLQHMSKHEASLNAFQCSKCSRTFSSGNRLNAHILAVHNNYRPFKCNECDKAFAKRLDLKDHQHIHIGLKRYPCEECGKEFSHASNLKRHKLQHSGLRPYICSVCNAKYRQLANLKRHQKNHPICSERLSLTENEPGESKSMRRHHCGQCGLTFVYLTELKNHEERLHNTKDSPDTDYKTKHLTDLGRTVDALIRDMLCDNEAVNDTNFTPEDSTNKQQLPDDSKNYDLNLCQTDYASQNNEYNSDFLPSDILLINPYFNNFEPLINFESQPNTEYFNEDIILNTDTKQNDIDTQNVIINTTIPIDNIDDEHHSSIDMSSANVSFDTETNYNEIPNFDFTEDLCANFVNRTNQPTIDSLKSPAGEVNEDSMTIFEKDVDLEEGTNLTTNLNQLIGDNNVQFISAEDGDTFIIRLNSSIDAEQLSNMLNINIEVVDVNEVLNDVGVENPNEDPLIKIETEEDIDGIQNGREYETHIDVTQNVDQNIDATQSVYINVMQSDNANKILENGNLKIFAPVKDNSSANKSQNMFTTQRWVPNVEFQNFLVSHNVIEDIDVTPGATNCILRNKNPKVLVTRNVTQNISNNKNIVNNINRNGNVDGQNENPKIFLTKVVKNMHGTQNLKPSILRRSENLKVQVADTRKFTQNSDEKTNNQNINVIQRANPIYVMRNENPKILVKHNYFRSGEITQNMNQNDNPTQNESPNFNVGKREHSKKIETQKLSDSIQNVIVRQIENPGIKVQNKNNPNILRKESKIISLTRKIIQKINKTQSESPGEVQFENEDIIVTRKVDKSMEETQNSYFVLMGDHGSSRKDIDGTRNINSNAEVVQSEIPRTHVKYENGKNIFMQRVATSCGSTQNMGERKFKSNMKLTNNESPSVCKNIHGIRNMNTNIDEIRNVYPNYNVTQSESPRVDAQRSQSEIFVSQNVITNIDVVRKVINNMNLSLSTIKKAKQRMKQKPYKCEVCSKMFTRKDNYESHLGIHNPKLRKHKCRICRAKFSYQSTLNKHMLAAHSKSKAANLTCSLCTKTYQYPCQLKEHVERDHEKIYRFECEEPGCMRRFYRKYDLHIHMKMHKQTKTYACRRCSMAFVHSSNKIRHESTCLLRRHRTAVSTSTQTNRNSTQTNRRVNMKIIKNKTEKQNISSPRIDWSEEQIKLTVRRTDSYKDINRTNDRQSNLQTNNRRNRLPNLDPCATNVQSPKQTKKNIQFPNVKSYLETEKQSNALKNIQIKKKDVQETCLQTNELTNILSDKPDVQLPIILTNESTSTNIDKRPIILSNIQLRIPPTIQIKPKTQPVIQVAIQPEQTPDTQEDIQTNIPPIKTIKRSIFNNIRNKMKTKRQKNKQNNTNSIKMKDSNVQPDSYTNINTSFQSDSQSSILTNIQSDLHTGIQSDENYDLQSDKHTYLQSDEISDKHIHLESEMHSDKQADVFDNVDDDKQSKMHVDIRPEKHYDMQSDINTNLQSVMDSDKQADTPVNINRESDVHVNTQYDEHYDMQSDEQYNIQSDTQDDLQTVMLADIQTDINAHLLSEIQNEMHSSILSELQSDLHSDMQNGITYSNMQEDTQSDIDHDIHTKILSELQSDIQSDLQRALAEMPDSPLDSSYSSRQLLSDIDDLLKNKML